MFTVMWYNTLTGETFIADFETLEEAQTEIDDLKREPFTDAGLVEDVDYNANDPHEPQNEEEFRRWKEHEYNPNCNYDEMPF